MTVSLTGFMGCGKSTVGKALAELLGWEFLDLDEYVGHKIGRTAAAIIRESGEEYFRAVEAEAVRDIAMMQSLTDRNLVLALGGGTPTIGSIGHIIFGQTKCVYLRTSARILKERLLAANSDRPLLEVASFEKLLGSRLPVYGKAEFVVDTDCRTAEEVALEIEKLIKK